jgi:poly(ADP-ribose) glycohydrolase
VIVQGVERFSNNAGYGYEKFEWTGDHIDLSPFEGSFRCTTIVAFDAQSYKKSSIDIQFGSNAFSRELNKAYCAFFCESGVSSDLKLATGNWGAGVFLGDVYLKFVVQCMAAAVAGRKLLYLTWGDQDLAAELNSLQRALQAMDVRVGEMYQYLLDYDPKLKVGLLDYLMDKITQSQTQ